MKANRCRECGIKLIGKTAIDVGYCIPCYNMIMADPVMAVTLITSLKIILIFMPAKILDVQLKLDLATLLQKPL